VRTDTVRAAARRVLARGRDRPLEVQNPHEYGTPDVADAEYARVHGEWRNQRRRLVRKVVRRRLPAGLIAAAAVIALLWSQQTMQHWVLIVGGLVFGAMVVAWPLRAHFGGPPPPPVAVWLTWRNGRRAMATALRGGLDGRWHVAWDRLVPGWNRPVTLAVGPTGIWALWGTEPGYRPDKDQLATTVCEALGAGNVAVWGWAGQPWQRPTGCSELVTLMVVGEVRLSPAQVRQWAAVVDERTMSEPITVVKS